eukprot:CAMPEP_0172814268 /NCGR_PEP_ID=MMETSP1075-20121228/11145_1 /TAXON_ID=2916 /ORGANISM="Ceratium fusus, Strain PA161109" /LENGTH=196 /DNA_ID=CAMNT_0013654057 /DNA_START=42 /DNA_END=629 /DNA_ORIENTATION=+
MKQAVLVLLLPIAAALELGGALPTQRRPRLANQGRPAAAPVKLHQKKHINKTVEAASKFPVNDTNALAHPMVRFFSERDCKGQSTKFDFSSNAFLTTFKPYIRNLGSVKLCGKGTMFYYSSPDMDMLALLGHIRRCGPELPKTQDECECRTLSPQQKKLVESFTLQYAETSGAVMNFEAMLVAVSLAACAAVAAPA